MRINTTELIEKVQAILEDRKAEQIVKYDVVGRSSLADAILIANCTSSPHLKAVAGALVRELKKLGEKQVRISGEPESAWIVVDLFDVIVHLFLPEARTYYDLDSMWQRKK